MIDFKSVTTSDDFTSLIKRLDSPSSNFIEEITLPPMKFITITGQGSPESTGFHEAIQALYGIAFTIKMGLKFNKLEAPDEYYDFKVSPLEGLWWQNNGKFFDMNDKASWQWRLMIMVPDFVDNELVEKARVQAVSKHPDIPYHRVILEEFEEGKSIQTTHIGPYADEAVTVKKLLAYAKEHNYRIDGKHHEIYMGDPRRTKPEKLKTVIRYPVAREG